MLQLLVICPTIKSLTKVQKIINPTTQKITCPTLFKRIKTPITKQIICPTGKVKRIISPTLYINRHKGPFIQALAVKTDWAYLSRSVYTAWK